MTGTTKAVWGAAALVTGATVLTGVIVIDRIDSLMYYYKHGYTKAQKRKEINEKWIKKSSKR